MNNITVGDTFDAAIMAEKNAEQLFRSLEAKFSHNFEVALLWRHYADDEVMHAIWLEALKAKLNQGELARPIDKYTIELLDIVAQISIEKALESIYDLEDAVRLVNHIEHGETNAIFRFLVGRFEVDKQVRDFMRTRLNVHVARSTSDLSPIYKDIATRRKVKAIANENILTFA